MNRTVMLVLLTAPLLATAHPAPARAQAPEPVGEGRADQRAPAYHSLRERSAQLPIVRRIVTVELVNVPLPAALERIAEAGGLRLTYSADILPAARTVSLNGRPMTTAEALLSVLGDEALDVLVSAEGGAVIVRRQRVR